jgi:hypothetical protein
VLGPVRLTGATRLHSLKRKDRAGHVEYRKAQCGESRMLRLGGGKEREFLPIRTKGPYEIVKVQLIGHLAGGLPYPEAPGLSRGESSHSCTLVHCSYGCTKKPCTWSFCLPKGQSRNQWLGQCNYPYEYGTCWAVPLFLSDRSSMFSNIHLVTCLKTNMPGFERSFSVS